MHQRNKGQINLLFDYSQLTKQDYFRVLKQDYFQVLKHMAIASCVLYLG